MKIQILKIDGSKGFKFLTGINRDVIPSQVTKLAASIELMGIIRPVVVADISFLDERGTYILDGQHLFYALMRADLDIPYIKIPVKDKRDMVEKIALLNSSSRSWALKDYITAWSNISVEYKKLQHYFNTYDFELCLLSDILMGNLINAKGGGTGVRRIKKGEFKIVNEAAKKELLDCLTDVLKILPRMDRFQNLYLCREFVKFYNELGKAYDHEKLLRSLEKKKSQFVLSTQEEGRLVEMFKKLV
jgi:hypothetical protein